MSLDAEPTPIPPLISMEDPAGNFPAGGPDVRYSLKEVKSGFSTLSPRRQFVYQASCIAMAAMPVLLSLAGILFCGFLFYRNKLKTPITLLSSASEQIAGENLDFQISYHSGDEMGALCHSFEQMRLTLKENNQKLWDMVQERRRLQNSVAHDLRNPIAIIQGYAQYLQMNLPVDTAGNDKLSTAVGNILKTSHRLEQYTDSLRTISRLEELAVQPRTEDFSALLEEMEEDLRLLTEEQDIRLCWKTSVTKKEISLDGKILYRILENLISNAVRFAEKEINVLFSYSRGYLTVTVCDDGPGFSEKVLNSRDSYVCPDSDSGSHLGMGLAICRVLCRKHGGWLTLANGDSGGAAVTFVLRA